MASQDGKTTDKASDIVEIVADDARSAAATVKDEALSLAEQAKDMVAERAEEGKSLLTEGLGDFAVAVRRAADELKGRDQGSISQLIGSAAGGLESLSDTLSHNKLEDIVAKARDIGRNNPVAFFAGSVLAGIALGRFARASASSSSAAPAPTGSKPASTANAGSTGMQQSQGYGAGYRPNGMSAFRQEGDLNG